jgi:hypothetical protein
MIKVVNAIDFAFNVSMPYEWKINNVPKPITKPTIRIFCITSLEIIPSFLSLGGLS